MQVVIANIADAPGQDVSVERSILGPDVDLVRCNSANDEAALVEGCREADVVLTDLAPMTRNVIDELRHCKLISVAGTGYSSIDLRAAQDANIGVCAIAEYCTNEVADHVLLLILALCRRLGEYHEQVQRDRSWQFLPRAGVARLGELTLGIIGYGKIGKAVARRASGFGMKVLANDHRLADDDAPEPGVRPCDLETLLKASDIISLNCNMSPENVRLLDAAAFARMQRRPVIINSARGELIDELALVDALESGQVSAAGLDVLADEPPDLVSSPLAGRDNVILTPHIAFYSEASLLESRRISASNIRHFLDGKHELVRRYVLRPNSKA